MFESWSVHWNPQGAYKKMLTSGTHAQRVCFNWFWGQPRHFFFKEPHPLLLMIPMNCHSWDLNLARHLFFESRKPIWYAIEQWFAVPEKWGAWVPLPEPQCRCQLNTKLRLPILEASVQAHPQERWLDLAASHTYLLLIFKDTWPGRDYLGISGWWTRVWRAFWKLPFISNSNLC